MSLRFLLIRLSGLSVQRNVRKNGADMIGQTNNKQNPQQRSIFKKLIQSKNRNFLIAICLILSIPFVYRTWRLRGVPDFPEPCDPCLCLTQLNFSHVPHFRDASSIVVIAKLLIQFIHLLVEIFYPFFSEEILKHRVLMDDVDYYYPWVEYCSLVVYYR